MNLVERLLSILRQAGRIAKKYQSCCEVIIKPDKSYLTSAELKITETVVAALEQLPNRGAHSLIDEESFDANGVKFASIEKEYVWILDPIGGTSNYLNHSPDYGVYLGVIRCGNPWIGGTYFPAHDELFYCDESCRSWHVSSPFTGTAKYERLQASFQRPTNESITFFADTAHFKSTFLSIQNPACAGITMCWPLIGRGIGGVIRSKLWDFAAAWPIVHASGMGFWNLTSDKPLESFIREDYTDNLQLKDWHLICSASDRDFLRNQLIYSS